MAQTSAGTIIERAWKKLRKSGSSTDVPAVQEAEMLATLNDIVNEWRRAFKLSGEPTAAVKKETAFDLKSQTLVNDSDGIATSDTTITVDSASDFDSSGAAVIYDDGMPDVIEYTGKTATTLTGASGIDWSHDDNDPVLKLYALPSNFHSLRATPDCREGVQVNNTPYVQVPEDPKAGQFAIYDNGTSKYLWLPRGLSGTARVNYNKTTTTIDGTEDLVEWDGEYDEFGIWRLVELAGVGDDVDLNAAKVAYAKARADKTLADALSLKGLNKLPRLRPINPHRGLSQDDYYRLTSRDA